MPGTLVEIFTDGSCHTRHRIGTWVAIIFSGAKKKTLSAIEKDTTHNRMELVSVIEALGYVKAHNKNITTIKVFTDSQYVTGLSARREKLLSTNFMTGKGTPVQNADLVKIFFELLSSLSIQFLKIKAHQKKDNTINYNREADILSRKLLRNAVEGFSEQKRQAVC